MLLVFAAVHGAGDVHYDFGVFYYAARMILDGARTSLYDLNAQHAFQIRYNRPPELLFYYPATSLLPLLPLAMLPIQAAFALWTALSLALLTASAKSLCIRAPLFYGNWLIAVSLFFLPVALCLAHGQFSILVLACFAWCFALWRNGRQFAGGLVLALATVKFQLVAGFICVLIFRKKWRELSGFAVGCVLVLVLWEAIVGVPALLHYPRFLLECEGGAGVSPIAMANLRGLAALFPGPANDVLIVACLSLGIVIFSAWAWKDLESGFSSAILATMLVSYHFNFQDLSLALIPLWFSTSKLSLRPMIAVAGAAVGVPIVAAVAAHGHFAVLAPVLVAALISIRFWPQTRSDTESLMSPAASEPLAGEPAQ